jgi:hypothetical protein
MYGMLVLLEHRRTGRLIAAEGDSEKLKLDKFDNKTIKKAYFRILSPGKSQEGEKVWFILSASN